MWKPQNSPGAWQLHHSRQQKWSDLIYMFQRANHDIRFGIDMIDLFLDSALCLTHTKSTPLFFEPIHKCCRNPSHWHKKWLCLITTGAHSLTKTALTHNLVRSNRIKTSQVQFGEKMSSSRIRRVVWWNFLLMDTLLLVQKAAQWNEVKSSRVLRTTISTHIDSLKGSKTCTANAFWAICLLTL